MRREQMFGQPPAAPYVATAPPVRRIVRQMKSMTPQQITAAITVRLLTLGETGCYTELQQG